MSTHTEKPIRRPSVPQIAGRKQGKGDPPLVMLTAYTAPMTKILDRHADILLVGDSVGMVLYGMDSTLGVTLDMMINHTAAVVRARRKACVVLDMPFGSYEESPQRAFHNAARVMAETGCDAVKLEGGAEMANTIRFLVDRGIPVMGHVGLMPQQVRALGGFRARGKGEEEAMRIVADAEAVAKAGAFSMVIEGVMEPVGRTATEAVSVPTIGIGASPACDGQVLVTEDILGLFTDFQPNFVKRYANLAESVDEAVRTFAEDVRSGRFPGPEQCFGMMA